MVKKKWLLVFLLGMNLISIHAQTTITIAHIPEINDTLFYAIDDLIDQIQITPAGGNQDWDYNNLQASIRSEQIFEAPELGIGSTAFPQAKLLFKAGGQIETYYTTTNQNFNIIGFFGPDPLGFGIDLVSTLVPPMLEIKTPLNFFDVYENNSNIMLPFSASLLPDSLINQLPIAPDSMRIRIKIDRLNVVDAWGLLSIPGGTYDVLREKRTEIRETRLDAKVPFLGWQDITDAVFQLIGAGTLGIDTSTTYHFLNNEEKETIAILSVDPLTELVLNTRFKDNDFISPTQEQPTSILEVKVMPNPVVSQTQIQIKNITSGPYTMSLYNTLGIKVLKKGIQIFDDQHQFNLEVSSFLTGIYILQLRDAHGTILATENIIVQSP